MQPENKCFGQPIMTCRHCNNLYIDGDIYELEAMSRIERFWLNSKAAFSIILQSVLFPVAGIVLGYHLIFNLLLRTTDENSVSIPAITIGVLAAIVITVYRLNKYFRVTLPKAICESKIRLSNPTYAMTLKYAGFHIDEKYLGGFRG
jgi:hypothetical protein